MKNQPSQISSAPISSVQRPSAGGQALGQPQAVTGRPQSAAAQVVANLGGGGPSSTTTKKEIIDRIAANTRQKRSTVKRTVQAFLDTVIDELSVGNRLELRDFGVFEIKERAARTAQNPKTLERVAVPARKTVKFKVGRLMKESVEEPERTPSPKPGRSGRG